MKKLFTLFALMCLMVSGAWANYYVEVGEPLNLNDLQDGSEVPVLMYAGGEGSYGFVQTGTKDSKARFIINTTFNVTSAPVSIDNSYLFKLKKSGNTVSVKTSDNKYLPGFSTGNGAYGSGTSQDTFTFEVLTDATNARDGGNAYILKSTKTNGWNVQKSGDIFAVNSTDVPLQFCKYTPSLPENTKVYTIYNDHQGTPYYVSNTQTKNGCQDITTNEATDNSQKWIVWGNAASGYTFYNLEHNNVVLTARTGTTLFAFDSEGKNFSKGITICDQSDKTKHIGGHNSDLTLYNGTFTNAYINENNNWSTDFVFTPTGQTAYKIEGDEGTTVTINSQSYSVGSFYVTTETLTEDMLVCEGVTATLSDNVVTLKKIAQKVTYTLHITGQPEGEEATVTFDTHPYRDGEKIEATNLLKKTELQVKEFGGYTYEVVINVEDETITVTYTAGNFTIDVLNICGLPESIARAVKINGTTYTRNEFRSYNFNFSGLDVQPIEVPGYTANYTLNDKKLTVTYTANTPLETNVETEYYVNIKTTAGYKYADDTNTIKDDGIKSTKNSYVWRMTCDGAGNKTLTNGQSGATISPENDWEYEPVTFTYITHVSVFDDGGAGYAAYSDNKAYNNGFLTGTNSEFLGVTYGDVDGKLGAGVANSSDDDIPTIILNYYTQEQALEGVKELTYRMADWYGHVGKTGYQKPEALGLVTDENGEIVDFDPDIITGQTFEDIYMVLALSSYWMTEYGGVIPEDIDEEDGTYVYFFHPRDFIQALNEFNKICSIKEIVLPEVGNAYRLSVRTKDYFKQETDGSYKVHRKYLKADGTLTENKEEASVFVLGKDGKTFLLASNDNTEINYLTAQGEQTTDYDASTCAFTYGQMSALSDNDKIETLGKDRVGTFFLAINDKVITVDAESGTWKTDTDVPYMNDNYTSCIEMEDVDYPYNKVKMTAGNDRVKYTGSFATIYLPFPMTMPAGVEVYEGTEEKLCHVKKGLDAAGQEVDLNKDITFLRLNCIKEAGETAYIPAGAYILYSQNSAEGNFTSLPAPAAGNELVANGVKNVFVGSTENPEVYAHSDGWYDYPGDSDLWNEFKLANSGKTPYVLGNKSKASESAEYAVTGIGFYEYKGDTYPKGKAIYMKDSTTPAKSLKLDFGGIVTAIEALHGNTTSTEIYDLQGRRLNKVQKGQINVINGQKVMFN